MANYRLYSIDKFGHVVRPPELVTGDTDEKIVVKARSMVDGFDIEIWKGARRVAVLPSSN